MALNTYPITQWDVAHATPQPRHILISGDAITVMTGDDMPVAQAPQSVTPRQIRLALTAIGLRAAVETAISGADQATKDTWEYATEVMRSDPMLVALAGALDKTDADIDALFVLAETL